VTFCPTAGEPYRDKPRLYLDRDDFLAETDNAFMLFDTAVEGRFAGETHRVEMNGSLTYESPQGTVHVDPDAFTVIDASGEEGAVLRLEAAATMYAVMQGVRGSMPYLPVAGG
jgi:hypothetical protein